MLTYKQFGFGKVGYFQSTYCVTDEQVSYHLVIKKEMEQEEVTIQDDLNGEEKELVSILELYGSLQDKKFFCKECNILYEGEEYSYNGKRIEDESFIRYFNFLRRIIRLNHEDLSDQKIASSYDSLCNKIYHKNKD